MSAGPAYYNEIDPYAAQWLRNLIAANLITPGQVDERDIRDVRPSDVRGFARAHFFAGIGVWDYALGLARWPADRPVWTGSCPCQPFSAAGRRGGVDDERHLWPAFFHLIGECRPATVLGEQVASKDGLGWLNLVHADLEDAGYAVGVADLCAAGVGAPHIRQRLWFVADPLSARLEGRNPRPLGLECAPAERGCATGFMGDAAHGRQAQRRSPRSRPIVQGYGSADASVMGDADRIGEAAFGRVPARANAECQGGFWSAADWLPCRDGKFRPVEPGTFPLAHGAPARVGRLRAYGNAIVAEAAAAFIRACLDVLPAGQDADERRVLLEQDVFA